jgi:hypothetical protein
LPNLTILPPLTALAVVTSERMTSGGSRRVLAQTDVIE